MVSDHGYCSDLSGSTYSTCVGNLANTWVYKPYFAHESGPTFLNSPHARFSGTLTQNAQHSSDLSITIAGTYQSQFSENLADPTKNFGCTGCHDPHKSVLPAVNATNPFIARCNDCHNSISEHIDDDRSSDRTGNAVPDRNFRRYSGLLRGVPHGVRLRNRLKPCLQNQHRS